MTLEVMRDALKLLAEKRRVYYQSQPKARAILAPLFGFYALTMLAIIALVPLSASHNVLWSLVTHLAAMAIITEAFLALCARHGFEVELDARPTPAAFLEHYWDDPAAAGRHAKVRALMFRPWGWLSLWTCSGQAPLPEVPIVTPGFAQCALEAVDAAGGATADAMGKALLACVFMEEGQIN